MEARAWRGGGGGKKERKKGGAGGSHALAVQQQRCSANALWGSTVRVLWLGEEVLNKCLAA